MIFQVVTKSSQIDWKMPVCSLGIKCVVFSKNSQFCMFICHPESLLRWSPLFEDRDKQEAWLSERPLGVSSSCHSHITTFGQCMVYPCVRETLDFILKWIWYFFFLGKCQ